MVYALGLRVIDTLSLSTHHTLNGSKVTLSAGATHYFGHSHKRSRELLNIWHM